MTKVWIRKTGEPVGACIIGPWKIHKSTGYCYRKVKGKMVGAHRFAYMEHHKVSIMHGICVMHICDSRPCINVDHLTLGTIADNNADKMAKGRHRCGSPSKRKAFSGPRGTKHHRAKLTDDKILQILSLKDSGKTHRELAKMFGVSRSRITLILNGASWKHVTARGLGA